MARANPRRMATNSAFVRLRTAMLPSSHTDSTLWLQLQLLIVNGGLRLVVGIIILVAGWMAATWAKRGLEAGLARLPIDLTLKPLIASLMRYAILLLTVLLVVQQF